VGSRRLGVVVALGLCLLGAVGCGAGSNSGSPNQLTLALAEDPDELDPTISSTFVARIVFAHMCEKLYDIGDGLNVVPQLASGLPKVSKDGRTVTIGLRSGVEFNDGTSFDAAAVKQSLDRHRTLKTSSRAGELAPLKRVDVVDDHTIRIHLAQRFAPLTSLLADRSGMIMSPKALDKYGDKFGTHPVCVGPFRFKERVASDRIVLEKAPDYYDADRVALDRITFKVITEGPVRASNLRSGDVDVAERLEPIDVVSIKGDDSIKLAERTSLGYQSIVLNVGNDKGVGKPFKTVDLPLAKHPELREAFEDSLDRDVINKVVFFGQAVPGCSPISPVSDLEPNLKCPGRDLAKARALVKRSGVKTPIPLELTVSPDSQAIRLGEVVQAMAKEAGFAVKLQPTEFTTGLDRANEGDFQSFQTGWSGRVDPDGNLFNEESTTGPLNYAGASDKAIDDALNAARAEGDPAKRKQMYRDLVAKLRARRSTIWLYHDRLVLGWRKDVEGVEMRADGLPRLAFARKVG
jgi:peptide/nickel transport system substrate-binding protein